MLAFVGVGRKVFQGKASEPLAIRCLYTLLIGSGMILSTALFALFTTYFVSILTIALYIMAAGCWFSCSRKVAATKSSNGFSWPVLVLMIAGAVLFLRPGEYLLGNWDPGVYQTQGAAFAQQGSWLIQDRMGEVSDSVSLAERYHAPGNWMSVKYPGFYLRENSTVLEPQFFPLFPVAIAVLYELKGPSLALYAAGFFALASLFVLIGVGEELGGKHVARAGGLLLLLNPINGWFSGFSTAESALQFCFCGALWFWLRWNRTGSKGDALGAGWFLGLALFTSITALFLVPLFVGMHGLAMAKQKNGGRLFLPLGLFVLGVVLFISVYSTHYAQGILFQYRVNRLLPLIGLGVLGWGGVFWALKYTDKLSGSISRSWKIAWVAGVACLMVAGILFAPTELQAVTALWTPVGLLLAVTGLAWLAAEKPREGAMLLVVGLVFTAWFIYRPMMVEQYPWVFKRFLAVTLPLGCIGIAWTLQGALKRLGTTLQPLLMFVLILLLSAYPLAKHRDLLSQRDWRGLGDALAAADRAIPKDAVVITGNNFGPALEFLFGRRVLPYRSPGPDLDAFINQLLEQNLRVFVVRQGAPFRIKCRTRSRGEVPLQAFERQLSKSPPSGPVKPRSFEIVVKEIFPINTAEE